MATTGIAVVGAGPWGLTLTGAFARIGQVQVRWICELDPERRARAGAAHPGTKVTSDAGEALRDPDVAAVVVAVEPARHHSVAMRALAADKHVFVEKPLTLSASDADEIGRSATARGLVLATGHLLLHHPAIREARQLVTMGRLGEPLTFVANRATPGPPRKPGSAWWALAPHDVSLALHLLDEVPAAVSADVAAWNREQEDDATTAVLWFSGGRTARIHVARFSPRKRRDMTIAGPRAALTFDELAPADCSLQLSTRPGKTVVVPVDQSDALGAQCRDFIARITRADTTEGNCAHAIDVVRVLEAGHRSMRRQGAAEPVVPVAVRADAAFSDTSSSFEAA
jgi:predicted dehydrogenase